MVAMWWHCDGSSVPHATYASPKGPTGSIELVGRKLAAFDESRLGWLGRATLSRRNDGTIAMDYMLIRWPPFTRFLPRLRFQIAVRTPPISG